MLSDVGWNSYVPVTIIWYSIRKYYDRSRPCWSLDWNLNLIVKENTDNMQVVAPRVGAWIETALSSPPAASCRSHPCACAVSEESATRCARGCSTTFCRGGNIFVNRLIAIYIIFRCPAVSDFKGLTGMAWKDNMQHIRNLTEVFLPR